MHARFLTIAAAALALAGTAVAQPAKPADTPSEKPSSRAAPVVLASAEQIVGPSAGPNTSATVSAKRPRVARVTTCRCGGDPQPEQEERQ